jgi:hypothetical protein
VRGIEFGCGTREFPKQTGTIWQLFMAKLEADSENGMWAL